MFKGKRNESEYTPIPMHCLNFENLYAEGIIQE
jgi:hypothetical protein